MVNSLKKIHCEEYDKGYYPDTCCRFSTDTGKPPYFDYKYCSSNGYVTTCNHWAITDESIRPGGSLSVFAEYEDIHLYVPVNNNKTKIELLPYSSTSYKYILKKGESIRINYTGDGSYIQVTTGNERADCFECDDWTIETGPVSYSNCYYDTEAKRDFQFDNRGYHRKTLCVYAGYDTDVTLKIPYVDIEDFHFSQYEPFKDFTLNPHEAVKITSNPKFNSSIHFNLLDDLNNYYFEEFTNKDNKFVLNSLNTRTDYFDSHYGHNSYVIRRDDYTILQNVSDQPRKFRIPTIFENCVSSYKVDSTIDLKYDVNNDNIVNLFDLAFLASKYNLTNSDSNFDIRCDLNNDGICDIYDIVTISSIFDYE